MGLTYASANPILGCTDPLYCNYNPNATQDNGMCSDLIFGDICSTDTTDDDNDGVSNTREIADGTNPLDANDYNPCSKFEEANDHINFINEQCCTYNGVC